MRLNGWCEPGWAEGVFIGTGSRGPPPQSYKHRAPRATPSGQLLGGRARALDQIQILRARRVDILVAVDRLEVAVRQVESGAERVVAAGGLAFGAGVGRREVGRAVAELAARVAVRRRERLRTTTIAPFGPKPGAFKEGLGLTVKTISPRFARGSGWLRMTKMSCGWVQLALSMRSCAQSIALRCPFLPPTHQAWRQYSSAGGGWWWRGRGGRTGG